MFTRDKEEASIVDDKLILTIENPISTLLSLGFVPSKRLVEDTLKEAERLVDKQDTLEKYKDTLMLLNTKEAKGVLKVLNLIKPQVKIDGFYYNDVDTSIFEPTMLICDIIKIHGLDSNLEKVKKSKDLPEEHVKVAKKLEKKKASIVKGGYAFGEHPEKIDKYNSHNKKLIALYQ